MQQSLRAQLLTLLGGSFVLIFVTALACFNLLANSLQSYHGLVEGPLKQTSQIDAANLEFKEQVQEWKNTLLRGHDSAELQRYWSRFEEQERAVQRSLSDLAQSTSDNTLKAQVEQLRNEHQALGTQYRKALETFRSSGANPVAGDRAVTGIDRATSAQLQALVTQLHQYSTEQAELIERNAERQQWFSIAMLLAAMLIVAIAGQWLISRNLINPIRYLIAHITKLSHGQFDQRVDSRRQDELGELAQAANALRDFLADTSTNLRHTTKNLDSTSGELNSIAGLMNEGSRDQFSRTDQVAAAMHEMSATSQEVANYAANAAQAADQAEQATQHGEVAMTSMVQSINVIRSEITSTAQVIVELQHDSARIGEVLEVIRGIAEQTNLLALNAAIEAARAGEQGRGFAVVADEVRSLAQRTAESTAEINQMISAVQSGALNAVRAIENGQRSSEEGVNQVMKAGEILRGVTDAVEQMRDMNRQIATAAEEQTSVAEDISRNLTEITAIAHTNQQTVERTHSASQTLQQLSAELAQVTQRLGA